LTGLSKVYSNSKYSNIFDEHEYSNYNIKRSMTTLHLQTSECHHMWSPRIDAMPHTGARVTTNAFLRHHILELYTFKRGSFLAHPAAVISRTLELQLRTSTFFNDMSVMINGTR